MPRGTPAQLKQRVRQLAKAHRSLRDRHRYSATTPPALKAACLLILILDAPAALAKLFYLTWLETYRPEILRDAATFQPEHWQRWLLLRTVTDILWQALADCGHPVRVRVERWITESRTAYRIHEQNMKGVVVPYADVLAWYYIGCSKSPAWHHLRSRLGKVLIDANAAKNWARLFRSRWQLLWGFLTKAKPLNDDQIPPRAPLKNASDPVLSIAFLFSSPALDPDLPPPVFL